MVIPLILLTTSFLGLVVGLMIHVFEVQPFIATLAAMFLARGLCYVISNRSISIEDPFFVAMAQTAGAAGRDSTISPSAILAVLVVAGRLLRAALGPGSAGRSTPSAAASRRRC